MTEDVTSKGPWSKDEREKPKPEPLIPGTPDPVSSYEYKSNNRIWYYHDRLRYYLLALGKDSNALEPLINYPDAMDLPNPWTTLFKEMAAETALNGNELYTLIGSNKTGDILLPLSKHVAQGDSEMVHSGTIRKYKAWAREQGMENIIGDFHTHPKIRGYGLLRMFSLTSAFSAGDMYSLVIPDYLFFMGVIHTNRHITAGFRTRDTRHEQELSYLPRGYRDQNSFEDFWYRKFGMKIDFTNRTATFLDGKRHRHDEYLDKFWEVNMAIAEKHYIALYRGSLTAPHHIYRKYPNPTTQE